ncbi:MAG: bifunctional 1-(5-phosphoribosyl)-5-((5-phosphoribosylamino)methylideneamino)imidazole-4-carboxamide isomerase/phosphoribosylanthranilate isomerase PriA [Lawsonella sp.]|nr:bifunctional 1-(5-phosphoribosyl)-5-((5-phosphoribosylamino)methylideneamino)imidazole-4-carboxamide isomerase/phosphoribosylanthranilate isomerase PriA [Mycobacteriales bacterium]
MSFTLLPAVDIVDGQAVRLLQGEAGTETSYGTPLEAALKWQNDGAEWLHLVDLDAAFRRGSNYELIREMIAQLDLNVELSGGIWDDETLERALATGCRRVNIGTAAIEKPEWCAKIIAEYGDRVAVGLDVRVEDGEPRLRGRGWVSDGGNLWEVLERLNNDGCSRYVVTDVSKDGMLSGPNLDMLREVAEATDAKIVASGGVSSIEDLVAIAELEPYGVDSAITGKALYAGKFTLPDALAAVKKQA